MPTPVIMPKFEMAQETGTVLRWLKAEGDAVEKGDAVLEVETDKVTMEVEAPASGRLAGIDAEAGEVVPIGETIAYILAPDEEWSEPEQDDEESASSQEGSTPQATPVARRMARERSINLDDVSGSGAGGRITKDDVEVYAGDGKEPTDLSEKVKAVPAARRLARELDVALETVRGTGPGGRIQSVDVQRHADESRDAKAHRPAVRRRVPLNRVRRTTAQRMTTSVREAPQFTTSADIDMSRALAIVDDLRSDPEASDESRVTLTTFLVKAVAWTLERHPDMNASFEDDEIVEWADVNIGVAVATDDGLLVPVVHNANDLGIRELAARLDDLIARARNSELTLDDLQAGTFTISNLGMFDVDSFTAILNPPQAGILAVGRVSRRAIVTDDDTIIVQPTATLTLTADHRALDGAATARFLSTLRQLIEHPGLLLE